jgi:hypothetical protein
MGGVIMYNRTVSLVLLFAVAICFSFPTETTSETQAKKHRKEQIRPIKLGTSGGNNKDANGFFCCSGTLGALVEDISGSPIKQYVLSNNHVLGLGNKGKAGDDVDQPGLIDHNCFPSSAGPVADLSRKVNFKFGLAKKNFVDAAIAQVRPGAVDPAGAILDIGLPGQPIEPALGDKVQKVGRTTGKRAGKIVVLATTLIVPIPTECGGSASKTARFEDQMIIQPAKASKPFSQSGDSGSLVVQKKTGCPAAIGLLAFGDNNGFGGANRIQTVLSKLKVKIVGCDPSAAASQKSIRPFSMQDSRILQAVSIKDRYVDQLIKTPGVSAVGVGHAIEGSEQLAVIVFVTKGSVAATNRGSFPMQLETFPVRIIETSGFRLM